MSFEKITRTALILWFCFAASVFCQPWQYGQLFVKNWADGKKAAFSFTFDDAAIGHYTYAKPILDSFGFKATFFLPTSFITDTLPGILRYGTWNQFREMSLGGHEMGSHTVNHPNLTALPVGDTLTPGTQIYELYQSQKTIEQKIPNRKCISFAYPSLAFDTSVINLTSQFYQSARTGASAPIDSALKGTAFYRIGGYEELFNLPRNSINDDLDELYDFENYVQNAIYSGRWGILEAHEVVPFSQIPGLVQSEYYPMSSEWLTSLCQWLKQKSDNKEIWIETMGNIVRYMKEREILQYEVFHQTDYRLKIFAYEDLDKDIYNYPLSVLILVPPTWNRVVVTQDSTIDTLNTIHDGADTYVNTHLVPNGGMLNMREINLDNLMLPVELTTFTAAVFDKGIKLNWITSTEINNNQFRVERMFNNNNSWSNIGTLPGAGNSNSVKTYSFIDNSHQSNGKYFYRLKMIDNDGQFKYSDTVALEINSVPRNYALAQNYPNPFNPSTKIRYEVSSMQFITLKVYNVLGKEIQTLVNEEKPIGSYELTWNAANLPSGVYYYRIQAGNFSATRKMILLK
jgi:peptidoglycan/xylan/chitin deacetylase (PgdA/CDA1 family)